MNDFKINEICPTTTFNKLAEGIILVDVRGRDEVEKLAFNVPNIMNIPLGELESRFNELPKNKNLVMVCMVGERSLLAAGFLIKNGFDPNRVTNMKLGMVRWVERGFPTIGETSNMTKSNKTCCG